jgi:WD40 repeat protein
VPAAVLAQLWSTGEFEVEEEVLRPLDNVAVVRWDRRANQVSLHDVIRRALSAHLDQPGTVHRKLLDAWTDPRHLPHTYAWRWYVWHCVRAGELRRIADRLADYEWLRGKLQETEINALLADFDSITTAENPGISDETRAAYKEIQSALRLSAHVLARDPSQLAGQLAGRLCSSSSSAARALATAIQALDEPALLVPLSASLRHPGGALERSLDGDSGVMSLAFLDNRTLLAGGGDGLIRVWNVADGSALAVLPAFSRPSYGLIAWGVAAIAMTPDGARVVAISEAGKIKLWEWAGWREILTMPGSVHMYGRPILALAPDGSRAVSGPSYNFGEAPFDHLTVWNLQTGEAERFLSAPSGVYDEDYDAVAISSDGLHVAAGNQKGSVAIWELQSGEQRWRWSVGWDKVQAVAWTPEGHLLICSGGRCEVWSTGEPKREFILEGQTSDVQSIALLPGATKTLTASADGRLRVWDLGTGRQLGGLVDDGGAIQSAAVSPDGSRAVSTSGRTMKIWSLGDLGAPDASPEAPAVLNISTPTGSRQAFVTTASALAVWDVGDLNARSSFAIPSGNIVATDGRRAVYSSGWGVCALDLLTGEESRINGVENWLNPACTAVALVPNSDMALSVLADHTPRGLADLGAVFKDTNLQLWDLASRTRLGAISLRHDEDVDAIAVLPDGSAVIITGPRGRVEVRELPSLNVLDTFPACDGYVGSLARFRCEIQAR